MEEGYRRLRPLSTLSTFKATDPLPTRHRSFAMLNRAGGPQRPEAGGKRIVRFGELRP